VKFLTINLGMTPKQEYTECASNSFEGTGREITVRVDDTNPSVVCGFHDIHQGNPSIHVDEKVLFHYTSESDATNELEISSFLYKVTVSRIMVLL
jgi:hypothetical protein